MSKPKKKPLYPTPPNNKEWLYVGHYIDTKGRYILKVGTTNDLTRRLREHNQHYRHAEEYTLSKNDSFIYDWYIPLSKYNTIRFEDITRENWKQIGIGEYVRNDRFCCSHKPKEVKVKIRKEYIVALD